MTQVETAAARRVPRRAGRRKVQVLEAAGRVIAERGADATRFSDVAAQSAVPISTLQYYFGSREDLLVAAFRHASGTEIAGLQAELAALDDPWDQLARIVTRALDGYRAETADPGTAQSETAQSGTAQSGTAQSGTAQSGMAQSGMAQSGRLWIESWHFGIRDAEMRADTLRDYAAWRQLVAGAVRSGVTSGRFATRQPSERIAVLAIALVDGVGIPLALGDPEITPAAAAADVLSALAELLQVAQA